MLTRKIFQIIAQQFVKWFLKIQFSGILRIVLYFLLWTLPVDLPIITRSNKRVRLDKQTALKMSPSTQWSLSSSHKHVNTEAFGMRGYFFPPEVGESYRNNPTDKR